MSHERDASDVIRDWREVLRKLGMVDRASPDAARLTAQEMRLQDEYSRLREEAFLPVNSLPVPR